MMTKRIILCMVYVLTALLAGASNSVYNVRDYGAVGDGKTLDHTAINRAIEAATADGGGQVVLPSGTYLCGSIRMKSNVELHLTAGATILLEEEATCRYFRQVRQEGNRTMSINKVKTTEVWALYNNIIIIFA